MNKEELKEYFKRTKELEKKLTGEDKETIQWMIYGYNQCAKKYFETLEELDKYKNIVDGLETYLQRKYCEYVDMESDDAFVISLVLDTLRELKGE